MQFTRNLRVIFNFTLRVITRNVTVTYRNVTGLYNPNYGRYSLLSLIYSRTTSKIRQKQENMVAFHLQNQDAWHIDITVLPST